MNRLNAKVSSPLSEVPDTQLAYWQKRLANASPGLELPTDHLRVSNQSFRSAMQPLKLSKNLADSLKALSQQEEVTLFMTMLAAFQVLLYRYTGQDDVIVGSPISNRNRTENSSFVNALPLRTDLSGEPTFRALLVQVHQVVLDAYAHQDLPFEKLIEELQPEQNSAYNSLYQVMFVFQSASENQT